jgi:hypothetical protein
VQSKAAITVRRDREEIERLWHDPDMHDVSVPAAQVHFVTAPGDRGTEIHVDVGEGGSEARAKAKDDLRRFKALVECGEIPRSEGSPSGVLAESQLNQRPAQPLEHLEHLGA